VLQVKSAVTLSARYACATFDPDAAGSCLAYSAALCVLSIDLLRSQAAAMLWSSHQLRLVADIR